MSEPKSPSDPGDEATETTRAITRRQMLFLLGLGIAFATTYTIYHWSRLRGTWQTLVTTLSPDGSRRAMVRCHEIEAPLSLADSRYHYYLSFEPPIAFRPVRTESTLKLGASAFKDDHVVFEWQTDHYIGYLQGMDDVDGRRPSGIEWAAGKVIVRSKEGIVGEFELRR